MSLHSRSVAELEAAALALASEGRPRAVATLVGLWQREGEPTPPARRAGAEAWLALCDADAAWSLVARDARDPDADLDTLAVAAQAALARRRSEDARALVRRALDLQPDDPRLEPLWAGAVATPTPLVDPHPPAEQAEPSRWVQHAERLLRVGRREEARRVLNTVPAGAALAARASDLSWAASGAPLPRDGTVPASWFTEPAIGDFGDTEEVTDHTEAAVPPRRPPPPPSLPAFPSLFREVNAALEAQKAAALAGDTTSAGGEAPNPATWPDVTEPGDDTDATQIRRVIGVAERKPRAFERDLEFDLSGLGDDDGVVERADAHPPASTKPPEGSSQDLPEPEAPRRERPLDLDLGVPSGGGTVPPLPERRSPSPDRPAPTSPAPAVKAPATGGPSPTRSLGPLVVGLAVVGALILLAALLLLAAAATGAT